ncbi:unnamed protein product [Kuraishia capsulata CBS 1993]|uniref:Alkaline phosphatase n=1 Tax=Kuraishia capsulata CBS 1993 TaxID=1382522 RepID=W6MIH3_9ASCO|nr:uncharacterized protein KUCA_T00001917001 [Kuraishia capsulata CBS 1993]CDK25946.1 unnamed protein product [Kuraishia capsulata CBS 1993]
MGSIAEYESDIERQGLLEGEGTPSSVLDAKASRKTRQRRFIHFSVISIIIYVILFRFVVHGNFTKKSSGKKNVIFMVTDGMGPASLSLARSFRQHRDGLAIEDILELDKHLIGASRTRSSDSLVTDSAAGATAFSCGLKSYNGAVGVNPEKIPCGTILEALSQEGYLTGLVVTTRITDATPAAFSAHADWRWQEDLIAEHQLGHYPLGRSVDLIIGGGRCHFLPTSKGGCRADDLDLTEVAQEEGWSYVANRTSFDDLELGKNVQLPLLALIAGGDVPYDIDRDSSVYPSLEEQVKTALTALTKATEDSEQGFFLMIEGSRIDHAGHHNDPAAQVREVLAYDKAYKYVIDFVKNLDTETIVVSTSDHETGGLVTARQLTPAYPDYMWVPQALVDAKHSGEYTRAKVARYSGVDLEEFVKTEVLEKDLGIKDYTSDDVKFIIENKQNCQDYVLDMVSKRSQTGWTTHGHSAVDVNIYGYSNKQSTMLELYQYLGGNHENIEIGKFMETFTGVNLGQITKIIHNTRHSASASEEKFKLLAEDPYHHYGPLE